MIPEEIEKGTIDVCMFGTYKEFRYHICRVNLVERLYELQLPASIGTLQKNQPSFWVRMESVTL